MIQGGDNKIHYQSHFKRKTTPTSLFFPQFHCGNTRIQRATECAVAGTRHEQKPHHSVIAAAHRA